MNNRTGWDDQRPERSRDEYGREQQGGWQSEGGQDRQHRQQQNWSGQQGGWSDDSRSRNRGRPGYGDAGDRQPEQREWRGSEGGQEGGQQGGASGVSGHGWATRNDDVGARGRDEWNRRDDWGRPGSQSFAADYGMRSGGADYDTPVHRTGYSGASTPGFGRGYGADYAHDRGNEGSAGDRGFLARAGDEIASWFGNEDAARRREQDYRGHGPSDYTRSDERIREDVNDRLTDDPRLDARKISVKVDNGEVTLNGTVTSRVAKRRAEDCAEQISGVKHVQNNLRIEQRDLNAQREETWQGDSTGLAGMSGLSGSSTGASASSATTGPTSTTGASGFGGSSAGSAGPSGATGKQT